MIKINGKPTCEGGLFIKDENGSMLGKCPCGWWARRQKCRELPTEKMRNRDALIWFAILPGGCDAPL